MADQVVGPNYHHEDHNNDNTNFIINNKIGFYIESFAHDMGSADDQAVPRQIDIASLPALSPPTSSLQKQNQHVMNIDDNKISTISSSNIQQITHRSLLKINNNKLLPKLLRFSIVETITINRLRDRCIMPYLSKLEFRKFPILSSLTMSMIHLSYSSS